MKKLLSVLLLLSFEASAQNQNQQSTPEEKISLRHIEGFRGFDITTGVNQYGKQFSLGYSQFESEKFIARIVLNYEYGKINLTSYNTNYIFIELNHTVFKIKDRVFLNLGYGALAGEENSSNEVLNNKTDNFSYGLLLDANSEIYVLNKLALLIEFKEIWDNGSSFGPFRYYANAGFRFYL